MEFSQRDIRILLLHEFRQGHTAAAARRNIARTTETDTISVRVAQYWFARFRNGQFDLEDLPRSGRPLTVDVDILKQLIEYNSRLTCRFLAEQLGCSPMAVSNHLRALGKTWKYGALVPYDLSPRHLQERIDTCRNLTSFRRTFQWLHNLVTSDEKWVLYANNIHRRQWLSPGQAGVPTPRTGLLVKKAMLCVWWNIRGIVHWEILPRNTTITAAIYCHQLDWVAEKLRGKQWRVWYLHDNARPHIARSTHDKFLVLEWEVIPHPPYSPDLAPTDYHLFRLLSHHLADRTFETEDDLKSAITEFFDQKSPEFYERGITSLPERWRDVIDNNGAYVNEAMLPSEF